MTPKANDTNNYHNYKKKIEKHFGIKITVLSVLHGKKTT